MAELAMRANSSWLHTWPGNLRILCSNPAQWSKNELLKIDDFQLIQNKLNSLEMLQKELLKVGHFQLIQNLEFHKRLQSSSENQNKSPARINHKEDSLLAAYGASFL